MAKRRSSRGDHADDADLLRGQDGPELEAEGETAAIRHERKVAADVLEHYIRFRCKDDMLSTEDWLELLEITLPKLQCRRGLLQIHKATRLSLVMMLVGSGRDPPLASRAISAMLVDHWCDKAPCSFLQKDAMRHSAVVRAELSQSRDKETIARHLEAGIEDALAGAGVAELEAFGDTRWNKDRDVSFAGGAESLQREFEGLARACRDAPSDSKARSTLEEYFVKKRMNTFEDDFMNWARAQLDRLPGTLFDRANFSTTAVSRPRQTSHNEGDSTAPTTAAAAGASAGVAGSSSVLTDSGRGGAGGGSSSSGRTGRGSPRRADVKDSVGGRRTSTPEKKTPPRSPAARAASGIASKSNGSGSGGSGSASRNSPGPVSSKETVSVEDDDPSASGSYGGDESSPPGAERGGSNSSGGNTGGSVDDDRAGRVKSLERGKKGRDETHDAEDSAGGDDGNGDADERREEEEAEEEEEGDENQRRPASSERRTGSDPEGAPLRRNKRRRTGGESSRRNTSDEEAAAATEALEEEAEAVAAEMVAARARPRRGAGKRNQGELFEGDQVFHVRTVLSDGDSDDSDGQPVATQRWVPGVVTANRKDGTYDVFLAGGGVARVIRRAHLYYRRRGRGGASDEGQGLASSVGRQALRPPGCPADIFESPNVIAAPRGGGGGGAGSRAGDIGEWHGGGIFFDAAASSGGFGGRVSGGGSSSSRGRRTSTPAGGDQGSGAGGGKERGRRSRVVVVIDSEQESEGYAGDEYEEDDDQDEDYVDGDVGGDGGGDTRRGRRTSARSSGGGGGRATAVGTPPSPRPASPSGGRSTGNSARRGKGKGPARVVSTDRKVRRPSARGPDGALAPRRKLADTAGFRGISAASPLRPARRGGSRASSVGSSFYGAVESEEEDDVDGSQYVSDSSDDGGGGSDESQGKEVAGAGRYVRRQEGSRKTHAGRGGGEDGWKGGRIRVSAAKGGGGAGDHEGCRGGQGGADGDNNAPSDTEIAAHVEEAAGWGGGGASDDSDGSSDSDSDAVQSRRRRPKLKGKGKGRSVR